MRFRPAYFLGGAVMITAIALLLCPRTEKYGVFLRFEGWHPAGDIESATAAFRLVNHTGTPINYPGTGRVNQQAVFIRTKVDGMWKNTFIQGGTMTPWTIVTVAPWSSAELWVELPRDGSLKE